MVTTKKKNNMIDDVKKVCPRCSKTYWYSEHAISRADNSTEVCGNCGVEEAQVDMAIKFMPELVKRDIAFMRKLLSNKK